MKKNLKTLILFILMSMVGNTLNAQILPPPGPGPTSGGGGPAAVPLDPVSWVMLVSGGGFAAKKYYEKKKSENNQEN